MISDIIDLYYFTGTGNTLLLAREMAATFTAAGKIVNLIRIETAKPGRIDQNHCIGIAFPIIAFATIPRVLDFIDALPVVNGTEIFAMATMGGMSGCMMGGMKPALARKGYTLLGAAAFRMPPNWMVILPPADCAKRVATGTADVRAFAHRLLSGTARWPGIPLISSLVHGAARLMIKTWKIKWHQRFMAYKINAEACTGCGLCVRLCPAGNLRIENSKAVIGVDCQYCFRCVSFCPPAAIITGMLPKGKRYTALSAQELLK